MKTKQQGFTLIELVMVIVILGILAVVAIPRFIDLRAEARQGATEGVAGALGSAAAINYATCQIAPSGGASKCVPITNCTGTGPLLQGGIPGGYTITAAALVVGTPASCTVTVTGGVAGAGIATFIGLATT